MPINAHLMAITDHYILDDSDRNPDDYCNDCDEYHTHHSQSEPFAVSAGYIQPIRPDDWNQ